MSQEAVEYTYDPDQVVLGFMGADYFLPFLLIVGVIGGVAVVFDALAKSAGFRGFISDDDE